jgi:hypothetical protein
MIIQTIFDSFWLIAVLVLLFLIWRSSERRLKHAETLEVTLVDVARHDAETARKAVEAVQEVIALLKSARL